jgi:hypothetical protein
MGRKNIHQILNTFIEENKQKESTSDFSKIIALNIPVKQITDHSFSVDLSGIVVFDGVETIVARLTEQLREACFFGQTDISVNVNVEPLICPQLYNSGIHKVFLYSAIESMDDLPILHDEIINHLRYIFNALQSSGISENLLNYGDQNENPSALLFPFNRSVQNDQTGLHYLVERVKGGHFLRITVDDLEHTRLNLRRIGHKIISNIELVPDHFNLKLEATTLLSLIVNRCRDGKLSFKDQGFQLGGLLHFLQSAGYVDLQEISVSWPRSISSDLIMNPNLAWQGGISRLMLILSDSTTKALLLSGKTIQASHNNSLAYIYLSQKNRNLQIDLEEKLEIADLSKYLSGMKQLQELANNATQALKEIHILFIHHFTHETLAVLGAFEQMKVSSVDTLWVKYSGSIPPAYRETIFSLPESAYRFFGLQLLSGSRSDMSFCISEQYSPLGQLSRLQTLLKSGSYEFYRAMQLVSMHLFLNTVLNSSSHKSIMIVEDGGYLAPLLNRLSLEQLSVGEVFDRFQFEPLPGHDTNREMLFHDWIKPRFIGSVEHTRNGYDALKAVETQFGKLAFPACTLAISNFKVQGESVEVAYSCLNAIENILNGQGFVLSNRKCMVLGSLGAIGTPTMKILNHRLGHENLSGVDLKFDKKQDYPWIQVANPDQIPKEFLFSTDLIFGVIGKSILNSSFFEDLILNTSKKALFLASGSTKRFEFFDFIQWADKLLTDPSPTIKGIPVKVEIQAIEDAQTSSMQGSKWLFELIGMDKKIEIDLLSYGMPVNFQYYGVPGETMDKVMAELVLLTKIIAVTPDLPPKLLALDHEIDGQGKVQNENRIH